MIVIYYFIISKHYIFAALSATFIVLGQIFGSFSDTLSGNKFDKLSRKEKIMAFFGFSGPWFIVKTWSDQNYAILQQKHRIWEIIYENLPGVALQIYAALTSIEDNRTSLIISICVSTCTVSYSVWM